MKKTIIFVLLIFTILICSSQNKLVFEKKVNHPYNELKKQSYFVPSPDTISLINITISPYQRNGWAQNGKTCAGCPSYYYKIMRSEFKYPGEDGSYYYYFYFYFYSNSFLSNGVQTSTYLSNINFFANNISVCKIEYILLEPKKVIYVAWIRSVDPKTIVSFYINNINVY